MCTYSSDRKGNLFRHIETTHQKEKSSKDKSTTGSTSRSSSKGKTPCKEEQGTSRPFSKGRTPCKDEQGDKVKTTPKVQRKVLPQYAPVLSELLSKSPSECRLKVIEEATSPQSPEKKEMFRQSPKEIRNELGDQAGLPDPRLFQRQTLDDEMMEIGHAMEEARQEATKLPAGDTSSEWKVVKMTEKRKYVVTTETAVKDGFYYRRVREEHFE